MSYIKYREQDFYHSGTRCHLAPLLMKDVAVLKVGQDPGQCGDFMLQSCKFISQFSRAAIMSVNQLA